MKLVEFEMSYLKKVTFESLVVTSGNRRVIQSANKFAKSFKSKPLIFAVWGSVGNGKTHLLGAICNEIRKHNPSVKILLANIERIDFSNLNCDMFVIDSADILLDSKQLLLRHLSLLIDRGISVLLSSAIRPSDYLLGTNDESPFVESEIESPSTLDLVQYAQTLNCQLTQDHILANRLSSFRAVEAEAVRSKLILELQT